MISLLIGVPLIGAFYLRFLLPTSVNQERENSLVKRISLIISVIVFGFSVITWVMFDDTVTGYQMVTYLNRGITSIPLGVDGLSLFFVVLTGLLTPICLLASWDNVTENVRGFYIINLVTSGLLMAVFLVSDLLMFYVAFESVLVPLFFMIIIWSSSNTRERSAYLLFLYTLRGSLFMLLAIMHIYTFVGSTDFVLLSMCNISLRSQKWLWIGFFIALRVKTPLVPFHIWLPRAHADAPLAGSMVLAGTVLKLATYGYLRVMITLLPDATAYFLPLILTVRVISLIYSSVATLRQVDFKALVAYSSVSHMAVVVLGLFSNSLVGIEGGILLSIAHGLVSPALFILVGGVLYDRYHTRDLIYYRGLHSVMPMFAVFFFIATSCNMGVPLSLNWVSEYMALTGIFQESPIRGVIGASGIVLSAGYSIWLWGRMVAGSWSQYISFTVDITRRETMVLVTLILPVIVLGIAPNILINSLHRSVSGLLYLV